jgi:hypothetical protein
VPLDRLSLQHRPFERNIAVEKLQTCDLVCRVTCLLSDEQQDAINMQKKEVSM